MVMYKIDVRGEAGVQKSFNRTDPKKTILEAKYTSTHGYCHYIMIKTLLNNVSKVYTLIK